MGEPSNPCLRGKTDVKSVMMMMMMTKLPRCVFNRLQKLVRLTHPGFLRLPKP